MAYAAARAKRHIGIAWFGAVALGAAGMASWSGQQGPSTPAERPAPVARPATTAPVAAAPVPAAGFKEPTEEELEAQMREVLKALAKTPGITRGVWQTKLTLSVDRIASEKEVWPWICLELERYPALRTTRVQLNPPPGSSEPVRWRQCKNM